MVSVRKHFLISIRQCKLSTNCAAILRRQPEVIEEECSDRNGEREGDEEENQNEELFYFPLGESVLLHCVNFSSYNVATFVCT